MESNEVKSYKFEICTILEVKFSINSHVNYDGGFCKDARTMVWLG